MARRRVKMTVGKALALKPEQIDKMSLEKLRAVTTILNSAANKRIKRAKQLGTQSEVIEKAQKGGRFKTSRTNKKLSEEKQLAIARAEFMRVRGFLQKETSSTRGVKKTQTKIIKKFIKEAKKITVEPTPEQNFVPWYQTLGEMDKDKINDLVWTSVDKLAEEKPLTKEGRYRVANAAYEMVTGEQKISDKDSLFKMLEEWAKQDYDNSIQEFEDVGDDEIAELFKDFTGI